MREPVIAARMKKFLLFRGIKVRLFFFFFLRSSLTNTAFYFHSRFFKEKKKVLLLPDTRVITTFECSKKFVQLPVRVIFIFLPFYL